LLNKLFVFRTEDGELPERLKGCDPKLVAMIDAGIFNFIYLNEIIALSFSDFSSLSRAVNKKRTVTMFYRNATDRSRSNLGRYW